MEEAPVGEKQQLQSKHISISQWQLTTVQVHNLSHPQYSHLQPVNTSAFPGFVCLCVRVWMRAQTHTCTCLLCVYVEQVWGCTHGWLSNRCWCSASAARPCSWIIKPRAIMAFTQINQSMLDTNCNWVSGYFLQHTWACSKCWVSIINGSCPTRGV